MAKLELNPFYRELQSHISQKTDEMISIDTPDASPVGLDRQVRILTLHREIKDLMGSSAVTEINVEIEGK